MSLASGLASNEARREARGPACRPSVVSLDEPEQGLSPPQTLGAPERQCFLPPQTSKDLKEAEISCLFSKTEVKGQTCTP